MEAQQPERHVKLVRTVVFTWKGGHAKEATMHHTCHHVYYAQSPPLTCAQFEFQFQEPCSPVTYVRYDNEDEDGGVEGEEQQHQENDDGDEDGGVEQEEEQHQENDNEDEDGGVEEEEEQHQENEDGDGDGGVGEASVEHPEVPDNTLPAALQPYSTKIPPEDPNASTRDATFIEYATERGLTQLVIPVAPS